MTSQEIVTMVEGLLPGVIQNTVIEIYDVEYVKEGPNWYLRIYIDKPGGVDLDDCELVSRGIEKILDNRDSLNQAYMLEVSSPGINRRLRKASDFNKNIDRQVDVKLHRAVDGCKQFQGLLTAYGDSCLTITTGDGTEMTFEHDNIAIVRLSVIL